MHIIIYNASSLERYTNYFNRREYQVNRYYHCSCCTASNVCTVLHFTAKQTDGKAFLNNSCTDWTIKYNNIGNCQLPIFCVVYLYLIIYNRYL